MFDYFYENEPKQYAFYSIPQLLFTDEKFKNMSCESKVLYGLLLDKAGLSARNGWTDEKGRVFVYYKREDVCEMLGCKKDKATKILAELDTDKGIGLIKRVNQGQGKPTRIYVLNFTSLIDDEGFPANDITNNSEVMSDKQNREDGSGNKTAVKRAEKPPSGKRKNRRQEDGNSASHLISHTKGVILSESFNRISHDCEPLKSTSGMQNSLSNDTNDMNTFQSSMTSEEINYCEELLKDNIEYDWWVKTLNSSNNKYQASVEELDEILAIMLEVICSTSPTIRVGRKDMPSEIVKERFINIRQNHIEYLFDCFARNTTKVKNVKSYIITSLYNATLTINIGTGFEVRHDFPQLADNN